MANNTSLRKRATRLGVLGAVVACLWLGGKFGFWGFGPGGGGGRGDGGGQGTGGGRGDGSGGGRGDGSGGGQGRRHLVEIDESGKPVRPEGGADARVDFTALDRPKAASERPTRLRVIIDEQELRIADAETGTSGLPADATEIAQLVKQATGDDQGIRIRIERTKRATAGGRTELLQALADAGISKEAIQEATDFLD